MQNRSKIRVKIVVNPAHFNETALYDALQKIPARSRANYVKFLLSRLVSGVPAAGEFASALSGDDVDSMKTPNPNAKPLVGATSATANAAGVKSGGGRPTAPEAAPESVAAAPVVDLVDFGS